MRYRKRPVEVNAIKFINSDEFMHMILNDEVPEWIDKAYKSGVLCFDLSANVIKVYINTLEGTHRVSDGDYIIQGVHGELYPCKPDIFAKTYERVE